MNYTYNGKYYKSNEGYVFVSNKTGIISKVIQLTQSDSIENYSIKSYHIPPAGYIYQNLKNEQLYNELLLSEDDSLLNYKLIEIKETESI